MKKLITMITVAATMLTAGTAMAQKAAEDKSKRPSPPAMVTETISSGATIKISYGQPSVKGRTIGKDLEPMDGKVWRAGANEATVFETDKPVTVEGKTLPAGKYAFFTQRNGGKWTLIFNKIWDTWGAYDYEKNKGADVAKITVPELKAAPFAEKLTYSITKQGIVSLMWGDKKVSFKVSI